MARGSVGHPRLTNGGRLSRLPGHGRRGRLALHPAGATVQVQSTDADGIADQGSMLKSGLYQLSLTGTAGDAYDGVLVGPDSRLIDAGADTIEVKIPAA